MPLDDIMKATKPQKNNQRQNPKKTEKGGKHDSTNHMRNCILNHAKDPIPVLMA